MPYIPISPLPQLSMGYPTVSLAPNPSYPSCPHFYHGTRWDDLYPCTNPQYLSHPCVPWCRMGYYTLFPPNPVVHPVLVHCRNWMGRSAFFHALPPIPVFHAVLIQHEIGLGQHCLIKRLPVCVPFTKLQSPNCMPVCVLNENDETYAKHRQHKRSSQSQMQDNKYVAGC